jgi:hypothetical protein
MGAGRSSRVPGWQEPTWYVGVARPQDCPPLSEFCVFPAKRNSGRTVDGVTDRRKQMNPMRVLQRV